MNRLRFCDVSDRAEPHIVIVDLCEVPVLSWLQVNHPALVVRLLKHQPVALHHVAGLGARHLVAILDGVAVVSHLVHLPLKIGSLVDPHLKWARVLEKCHMSNRVKIRYMPKCFCYINQQ